MKLLIIGAGAVGSVVAKKLAEFKDISKIIVGTNDIDRGKEFLGKKSSKIILVKLDASNTENIILNAKGVNLIINLSLPDFNIPIMKAALKVGANYQDTCSRLKNYKVAEQLKLHEQFKKAGLVALINTGVAPGITNLLARDAADKMDSVESIKFRLLEDMDSDKLLFSWSPIVALDELTSPTLQYKNGKFIFVKSFSGIEEYNFRRNMGIKKVMNVYGDEVSTIPLYIKTKNVEFKCGGKEIDIFKFLFELGIMNKHKVSVNSIKISPLALFLSLCTDVPTPKEMNTLYKEGFIKNAVFASSIEVIGYQRDAKILIKKTAIYPDLKTIFKKMKGSSYIAYPTGIAVASFARIIPQLTKKGVYPPEVLDSSMRKHILIELNKEGVFFDEEYSQVSKKIR